MSLAWVNRTSCLIVDCLLWAKCLYLVSFYLKPLLSVARYCLVLKQHICIDYRTCTVRLIFQNQLFLINPLSHIRNQKVLLKYTLGTMVYIGHICSDEIKFCLDVLWTFTNTWVSKVLRLPLISYTSLILGAKGVWDLWELARVLKDQSRTAGFNALKSAFHDLKVLLESITISLQYIIMANKGRTDIAFT